MPLGMPPPWATGTGFGQPAPTQLASIVPGVATAPVAGVSPGGYPIPTMPGMPMPGGAAMMPPQLGPTQGGFGGQPMPPGFGTPPMQGRPPQGFATPGFAAPGYGAPPQGFPGAFPPPPPDPQRLAMALMQHPAFQNMLGSWANAWLGSAEFKRRLVDILQSTDLQDTVQKGARNLVEDKAFLEEVAKRLKGQQA